MEDNSTLRRFGFTLDKDVLAMMQAFVASLRRDNVVRKAILQILGFGEDTTVSPISPSTCGISTDAPNTSRRDNGAELENALGTSSDLYPGGILEHDLDVLVNAYIDGLAAKNEVPWLINDVGENGTFPVQVHPTAMVDMEFFQPHSRCRHILKL